MGRPSKLTDKQWDKSAQRLLKGEKAADLAREFKRFEDGDQYSVFKTNRNSQNRCESNS
jgi:hypothetical protein